jgi:hypothetical protein
MDAIKQSDAYCVAQFAQAMADKMFAAQEKGRAGWQECHADALSWMLRDHVEKGDPVDVANFCMMLWCKGQRISSSDSVEPKVDTL